MLVAIDVASPQIVELLLLHGADCGKAVEAVSYWGQPLHRALYSHKCPRESYKQMFRLLVQATVCAPQQQQQQQQQQTASPLTATVSIRSRTAWHIAIATMFCIALCSCTRSLIWTVFLWSSYITCNPVRPQPTDILVISAVIDYYVWCLTSCTV